MKEFHAGLAKNKDNITKFYNKMDHATYDELSKYVNFTDPYHVTEAISNPSNV